MKTPLAIVLLLGCILVSGVGGQSHWEVKSSNTTSSLNAVTFGNGLFVAVGDNGTIVTSPDGETWTPRVSGTTDRLPAIAFGEGRFVATRANRDVPAISSADGIIWSPVSLTDSKGAPASSIAFDSIAFGGGRFMALGSGFSSNSTEIMVSEDGLSFEVLNYARYPAPFYLSEALKSITFFRGQFYAGDRVIGSYGSYLVSLDGVSWKRPDNWRSSYLAITDGLVKVALVGSSYSVDAGHTFHTGGFPGDEYRPPNSGPAPPIRAGCFGNGFFVVVNAAGTIWTSKQGLYWTIRARFANSGAELRGVAYDGTGRFAAVGSAPASGTALIVTAPADPPVSPPGYTVQSLQGIIDVPQFVSNSGIVGGSTWQPSGGYAATVLRNGALTSYTDRNYALRANGATDSGITAVDMIFGGSYGIDPATWAFVYPEGRRLFDEPGLLANAAGVNANGVIGGTYFTLRTSPARRVGLYRYDTQSGQVSDLGNFGKDNIHARAINDRGDLAGSFTYGYSADANRTERFQPFRVSAEGEMTMIPTLGGVSAYGLALNASGNVVGYSNLPSAPESFFDVHAFLYKDGVLSDIDTFNSGQSVAKGINSHGAVVGDFKSIEFKQRAFLYLNGEMHDLNTLLDSSGDGWILETASSINDSGWIVGYGLQHNRSSFSFLAIPSGGKPAGTQTRFVNVSTRLRTGAGDNALIGGFILRGGPRKVVVRALGPALSHMGFKLPDILSDPTLELYNERGELVAFNDNYTQLSLAERNEIGSYGLGPPGSSQTVFDSVIMTVLEGGNYTAVVRGKNGTVGNCLVEVYNVDTDYSPGLVNISTRGPVDTGDNVMIAGFVVRGDREKRILIRGIGPSLAASGVPQPLSDPALEIHDKNGQIAQNNDWRSAQEQEILSAGFPLSDNRESAVIVSLWPGSYTAIVRGNGNTSGNALVEVYQLPDPN